MGKSERSIRLEGVTSAKKITEMNIAQTTESKKKLTIKLRREMMREIIDSQPFNVDFPPELLDVVNALLHTDLIRIQRRKNPEWPNDQRHIWATPVCDPDYFGAWGWNDSISPKPELRTIKLAMRKVIQPDLKAFRDVVATQCEQCGTTDDLTTDHVLPFDYLAQSFLNKYGWPKIKDGKPGEGKVLADPQVIEQWVAFHTTNALYQILCRSCNSSKGTKFQ